MNASRLVSGPLFVSILVAATSAAFAQVQVRPADLVGTWELASSKNFKTGKDHDISKSVYVMQFTPGYWNVMWMRRDRPVGPGRADFDKLSDEQKVKANYASVWNPKHQQVFAARAGTYRVQGDAVHQVSTIALFGPNIGVDRVLRVTRVDRNTLVARTEYPDMPTVTDEMTFKRLD